MPTVPNDPGPATVLPQPTPGPSVSEVFGAEFRQSNTVVNAFQALKNMGPFEPVEGFSNWDQIKDKPQYLDHAYRFAGLRSQAETDNLKAKIDQDESDRRTLSAAGSMGIVAGAVSGLLDPTMLLPGRVAIGVLKDGTPLVRGALEVGGAMGVQSAAQESVLQATQPGRTLGESVVNVGSATILGAMLGGAASWLSPAEHAAAVAGLDHDRARMDANVVGRPAPVDELKVRSEINRLFNGEIGRDELSPATAALYDKMPEDIRKASEAIANNNNKFDRFLTEDDILDEEDLAPIRAERKKAAEEAAPKVQEWFNQNLAANANKPLEASSPGFAASAGAAATDTRTLDTLAIAPTGTGIEKFGFDKAVQSMNSPALTARRAFVDLAELPLMTKGNLAGEVTSHGGAPLETIGRLQMNQTLVSVRDMLAGKWQELRFGSSENAPIAPILRDKLGRFGGLGDRGDKPTYEKFKAMVSEAIQNDNKHDLPQVQAAAEHVSKVVFEKWGERAEGSIEGFKRAEQIAGEGYFPHLWNKAKVAAKYPEFVKKLTDHFADDQTAKRAAQGRLAGLSERLKASQKKIEKLTGKEGKETELADAVLEHDALRDKIEQEIGAWEGRSSSEAKSALKAREKYAEKAERPEGASRLRSADEAVDRAVKRILEKDRDLPIEDIRAKAEQTVDHILEAPDGRLPFDESTPAIETKGVPQPAVRGSLAERSLNVSNAFAKEFIENDIEKVVNQHMRTFIPDVLLAERFGDVEMSNNFRQLNEEYAALKRATEDPKKLTALEKQRLQDIENIAATRDQFRGLYNIPSTAAGKRLGRISQNLRMGAVVLNMGMGAVSSIPDAAGAVFRWGMMNVFKDAYMPFFKSLATNREYSKEVTRQLHVMGISIDTQNAARHHVLGGLEEGYQPHSPFERTLQSFADKMQIANGLAYWTDFTKNMAATVAMHEIYRAAEASAKGSATKKQLRNLAEANITPDLAEKIAFHYGESGTKVDGMLLPNIESWKGQGAAEAKQAFEAALSREVNISVVTPGLDRPKFLSDPLLSVIGQFKSFTAAATTRIMIANLQRADAQTLQGLVASLGMGMISYKINSLTGGSPTSDRPQDWIKEAMSRGNIGGWLEEGNALTSKMTRGKVDAYRLMGADKPLSRFAGRSVMDQLMGPTFGKAEALSKVTGAAASRDWNAGDIHAFRTFIAGQNLPYIRGLLNQVETGAANAFGVPAKQ